jgi:hypothetical protein
MDVEQRRDGRQGSGESNAEETPVRAHESRPGRLVFTEEGNTDAWIATDLAVDPEP